MHRIVFFWVAIAPAFCFAQPPAAPPDPAYSALANQLFLAPNDAAIDALLASRKDMAVPQLVTTMNELAGQVYDHRDYQSALQMYTVSCGVAVRIGDKKGQARCTYDAGLCHTRLYHLDEAVSLLRKSIEQYEALGTHADLVGPLNSMGVYHYRRGDYNEALPYYQRALAEAAQSDDPVLTAQTNTNLGNLYNVTGKYIEAIQCMQKALEITRARKLDVQSARLMNNLGGIYFYQHDLNLALSYHEQGLALKEKLPDPDPADIATSVMNVGVDLQYLGQYEKGKQYLERALKLATSAGVHSTQLTALYNYGVVLHKQGQLAAAIEKLNAAIALAERIRDRDTLAQCQVELAEIAVEESRHADAVPLARAAIEFGRSENSPPIVTRAEDVLGVALEQLGQYDEADSVLADALRLIDQTRAELPGDGQEQSNFMASESSPFVHMVELQVRRNRPELALAYAERAKARALLDVLQSGRADINKAMTLDEQRQETALAHRTSTLNDQILRESRRETPDRKHVTELATQLEMARNDYRKFELALYAAHPQLQVQRVAFDPVAPAALVASMPAPGSALLEYVVGDAASYLLVLTAAADDAARPDLRVYRLPFERKALTRDVARFREQIATRDLDYRKLAGSLYNMLVAPAREQLRGKTTLVVVPDAFLWQLPFQALAPAPDRYLLEDSAIFYTPSLSVLYQMGKLHQARKAAQPRLLAVDAAALPGAQREVNGLRQVYGPGNVKIYAGAEADEVRLKRDAPNYDVLHLAAHGVFEDRSPMNSYLVLAKAGKAEAGVMEARHMMDLNLNAEMVVLSGCETGRGAGEGEGLIGMSWALFIAGSPTTVASQWKVESDSTSDLMLAFHRRLKGTPKAKALQEAALDVMKKPAFRHPFYWSGFILMGEGF